MRKLILSILNCFFISVVTFGQSLCGADTTFRVLHFTKTSGFDHNTRDSSATMFTEIGLLHNFTIDDTEDASIFDELDSLLNYSIIIFSNTSGNSLFDDTQKANMEAYIDAGGSFLGIHAASDTYRTGWPWYNNLLGAIVQSGPNHTSQNHNNDMDHELEHEILEGIPDPWNKTEEYYYWDLNGGMIDTINFATLLRVRQTGNETYDRARPTTWFRTFPSGARSFYTALGHQKSNYTDSSNEFRQLISNAVCWLAYDQSQSVVVGPRVSVDGAHLQVSDAGQAVIMKSPNGSCYKLLVNNAGQLEVIPVVCPD